MGEWDGEEAQEGLTSGKLPGTLCSMAGSSDKVDQGELEGQKSKLGPEFGGPQAEGFIRLALEEQGRGGTNMVFW